MGCRRAALPHHGLHPGLQGTSSPSFSAECRIVYLTLSLLFLTAVAQGFSSPSQICYPKGASTVAKAEPILEPAGIGPS